MALKSSVAMLHVIMNHALGIDIGRVIIQGDGPDTSFLGATDEDAMHAPAVAGAFESIARLTEAFEGRVWLVSKCGPRVAERSLRWLTHHRFWSRTRVARERVRFCRERKQKAGICLDLGIGWFVDDRLDVLVPMAGVVPYRFLFGAPCSPDPTVWAAPTWTAVESLVTATREMTEERAP